MISIDKIFIMMYNIITGLRKEPQNKKLLKEVDNMFKVKMYTHENGEVIVREKVFYAIEKALEFYNGVQKLVTHGKLIVHNRVTNEF